MIICVWSYVIVGIIFVRVNGDTLSASTLEPPVSRIRLISPIKEKLNFTAIFTNLGSIPASTRESLQTLGAILTMSEETLFSSVNIVNLTNNLMRDSLFLIRNSSEMFTGNLEKLGSITKELGKPIEKLYPLLESQIELARTLTKSITGIIQNVQNIQNSLTNLIAKASLLYVSSLLTIFLFVLCVILILLIIRLSKQLTMLGKQNYEQSGKIFLSFDNKSKIVQNHLKVKKNSLLQNSAENLFEDQEDHIVQNNDDLL